MSVESRLSKLESEVLGSSDVKKIEELEAKLLEERKRANKLLFKVIAGESAISRRNKSIEKLNKDVARLDSGINALADTLNDRCKDLDDLDVENAKLKTTINAKDVTIQEIVCQRNSHYNRLEGQKDKIALLEAEARVLENANWHLSDIAKTKCGQVEQLDSGIYALVDILDNRLKDLEDLDGAFGHVNSLFSARETVIEELEKKVKQLDSAVDNLYTICEDQGERLAKFRRLGKLFMSGIMTGADYDTLETLL